MRDVQVRRRPMAALLFCLATAPAAAQDQAPASGGAPVTAAPTGETWSLDCQDVQGTRHCTMLQNLVAQQGDSQQRLLTVFVQTDASGAETLLLALPHGLFLPTGAQIQVDDGEPQKLVIQTSDASGAYAGTSLTPAFVASLRKGHTLTVSFQSAQRQNIAVPVTLTGFSAAYDRLQASKSG